MGSDRSFEGANRERYLRDAGKALHHVREARRAADRERTIEALGRYGRPVRTTFYIASPFTNAPQVQELAEFLTSKGWRWADGHNWTLERSMKERPKDDPFWSSWAVADIRAALSADVFVLLLKGQTTAGAHAEFGARWAMHRPIWGIRQDGDRHLFHALPGIVWFDQVSDFAQALFGT